MNNNVHTYGIIGFFITFLVCAGYLLGMFHAGYIQRSHPIEEGHLIETPTENITIESAATAISNIMKQARDCKLGEAKGNLYITSFETDEQIILDCAALIKGYGKLFDNLEKK